MFDSHLQALSMHSTQCSITILLVSWWMARPSLWVYGILLVKRITIVSAHSLTPTLMLFSSVLLSIRQTRSITCRRRCVLAFIINPSRHFPCHQFGPNTLMLTVSFSISHLIIVSYWIGNYLRTNLFRSCRGNSGIRKSRTSAQVFPFYLSAARRI